MSTLKTTNIAHPSSASNNIVLDASGNVNIDSNTLYVDATNNRVGIGTTSPVVRLHVANGSSGFAGSYNTRTQAIIEGSSSFGTALSIMAPSTGWSGINFGDEADEQVGNIQFVHSENAIRYLQSGQERARIDSSGRLLVGTITAGAFHILNRPSASEGNPVLYVGYALYGSAFFFECNSGFYSSVATAVQVCKNTSTNRSINAGGTINASGTDYAEYMVKAGDFIIAKGSVCGVTADGLLTLDYADAMSFVVKSTNPSYVGGDTWGSEDVVGKKPEENDADALAQWETDLEAARQKVDRIAFAGQVPVNVLGATPGQYIVPVEAADGGIEGVAKNEADLTLAEYIRAVGKVIAIEDDGRARIIVKVA